jgi:ribosomal protein S11
MSLLFIFKIFNKFMLLLYNFQKKNLSFNKTLKNYIKKLNKKIIILKQIQKKQKLKKLQVLLLKNRKYLKNYFQKSIRNIKYIVVISVLKSNTFVHLTDVKGNLKLLISAGTANLSGKRQKSKLELALSRVLTVLTTKTQYLTNQSILVHIKNAPLIKSKSYIRYIIGNILEKRFNIVHFVNSTLLPHNGCRPKKIKRGKKRSRKIKFLH